MRGSFIDRDFHDDMKQWTWEVMPRLLHVDRLLRFYPHRDHEHLHFPPFLEGRDVFEVLLLYTEDRAADQDGSLLVVVPSNDPREAVE